MGHPLTDDGMALFRQFPREKLEGCGLLAEDWWENEWPTVLSRKSLERVQSQPQGPELRPGPAPVSASTRDGVVVGHTDV